MRQEDQFLSSDDDIMKWELLQPTNNAVRKKKKNKKEKLMTINEGDNM